MTETIRHALVTGGGGFLGSQIVRSLLERGVKVRVLALPDESTENLEGLDVEIMRGNILNVEDCAASVEGVDTVFHAAAIYKAWMPDPSLMYDVNIRGTYNVLEAARRAEVEKVIYTASIVSLGRAKSGGTADEDTPYNVWDIDFSYSRAKYLSREAAEDFARWGMDVRVVCPAVVFGPGDRVPTPSGKLIINTLGESPPVYLDGGTSYVDVRDAAEIHVLAAERGRAGERYLAAAVSLSNLEFLQTVCRLGGRKRRFFRIPVALARAYVKRMEAQASRTGEEPLMTSNFLEYSLKSGFFSGEKAVKELGATYRPFDETMADAVAYFRERGQVT